MPELLEVLGMNAEGQEDRDYWNTKYADTPHCEECGIELEWDEVEAYYFCPGEGSDFNEAQETAWEIISG